MYSLLRKVKIERFGSTLMISHIMFVWAIFFVEQKTIKYVVTHRKPESLVLPAFSFYCGIWYSDISQSHSHEMPEK